MNYFVGDDVVGSAEKEIVYQEVRAAYGTKTKFVLNDSTVVWLNSGSTLRFPISFEGMDERKVALEGEAYFEVTKNVNKPFIVDTKKLDVKVYGTSFNVNAYDDYNSLLVVLVEGKVSLLQDGNDGQKEVMVLRPNDVVSYDVDSEILRRSRDSRLEKYTAWKEGSILFYNDPIDAVIKRLEKWYNIEIQIEDAALKEYRFTATFNNESLEQVLELLSLSSAMDYEIVMSENQSNDDSGKRKILLRTKNN
nr:FecR domain-containing protein [Cellulophaga sp. F20128]